MESTKAESQDKQIEQSSEGKEKENAWRDVEEEEGKNDDKMLCSGRREGNGQESQAKPSRNMDSLAAWVVSETWHCGVPLSKSKRSEDEIEEQGRVSSHEEDKRAAWQLSHLDEKEKPHHDGTGSWGSKEQELRSGWYGLNK